MRILFLHHGQSDPSTRFRIHPWLPLLEAHGMHCDERPMKAWRYWSENPGSLRPRGYLPILETIFDVAAGARYDAIFTQRFVFPHRVYWLDSLLRCAKRLIVDVSDALFCLPNDDRSSYEARLRGLCRMADCVLASNAFMADWIDLPDKTVIMPTVVDYGAIPVREYTIGKEKVTIGWTGQVYQLEYIRPLFPVLRELSKDSKVDVLFHTSSIKPTEELAEMGIKIIPFDPRREFELLQSIDIGLMPMPKTTFNLGKCPLKLIQYMASGAAVVCSPVGSNMEMIQEGVQGYFAGTPTEWYERLKLLIQNLDKRIAMGRAGRRRVEEQYSTKAQWPHFKETVMRLLEKPS